MDNLTNDPNKGRELSIELVPGNVAPRYTPEKWRELRLVKAVITENGMASGFPLVDIQLQDADGKEYFAMVSGGILITLAAALRGINMRNHGREEQ